MCWVHEWAAANNSLEWAKIHIERASVRTKKRGQKVYQNQEYLKIHKDEIETTKENMEEATRRGKILLEDLTRIQTELKAMIEQYGISRKDQAPTLTKRMEGRRRVQGGPWK